MTGVVHDRAVGQTSPDGRATLARLGAGIVLLLLAFVVFAGSRWAAGRQHHAYDPGATPRPVYHVTDGRTYQLSTSEAVERLSLRGALSTLSCTWSADGQVTSLLVVTSTLSDERNRHQFALFTAQTTGAIHISCADIATVFVDDADDRSPDWAGALMLITVLIGVAGVILTVSGGYELTG